jgi:four helix bundle protein
MGTAQRFKDLVVWKEARKLRKEIAAAVRGRSFERDWEMRRQVTGAALSVMSNIAEGFEPGTNKEFAQFLHTAKGSVGEVRSILYAALDDGYIPDQVLAGPAIERRIS